MTTTAGYGYETTRPPETDHPETSGWFDQNGELTDTDLSWLDTIAPDPEDD